MNARQLIEAEDPKSVFRQVRDTPRTFTSRRLTPRELERLATILSMGPVAKRPIDDRFLEWGYIEYYDNDEHDAVVARPGFAEAFYNHREIKGAFGDEWSDLPSRGRGRVRSYYWREGEDPKHFLKKIAPAPALLMQVNSSHGTFYIDGNTGRVVQWPASNPDDPDAQALGNIEKFDLPEWKAYWRWEGEVPGGFDILDLGFWMKDGTYEPAEEMWREEIRQRGLGDGHVANPE